jgi:hypothetical protein
MVSLARLEKSHIRLFERLLKGADFMDKNFLDYFTTRWQKYFTGADLPICYFYTNEVREEDLRETEIVDRCLIANLERVQAGLPFVIDAHTPVCSGGIRYTGFSKELSANFEYLLSCGIPGELEGERYKKSPELVKDYLKFPPFEAPAKYLVFKRLDKLAPDEEPFVVIFFATPDVLSGLYGLANYDYPDPHGVIAPMGSGCLSIISYPFHEAGSENPKCVLGMFDVAPRLYVPQNTLTLSMPMKRFEQMVRNMDESLLITNTWESLRKRL